MSVDIVPPRFPSNFERPWLEAAIQLLAAIIFHSTRKQYTHHESAHGHSHEAIRHESPRRGRGAWDIGFHL